MVPRFSYNFVRPSPENCTFTLLTLAFQITTLKSTVKSSTDAGIQIAEKVMPCLFSDQSRKQLLVIGLSIENMCSV